MDTVVYHQVAAKLRQKSVKLVAVSKTHPNEAIMALYDHGQRIFGENRVQELVTKYESLPKDIQWHLIGHLQTNKVKLIAPFVALIHSVDSLKLLIEIDKQADRNRRVIDCLLQCYIASEETKFGLDENELYALLDSKGYQDMQHIRICGLMGMASLTEDEAQVRREFHHLAELFKSVKAKYFPEAAYFRELSMGMSGDYGIAIEEGSTMVRIGSLLFGART